MRSALVYGGTGLVGGRLLRLLLADPSVARVTAITRRTLGFKHEKLGERITTMGEPGDLRSLREGEDVFCCLGTTIKKAGSREAFRAVDFDIPLAAAKAAAESRARSFLLVSSLGADSGSRFFYNRVKGELEEAIEAVAIPALHIFRPSLLLGERAEPRLAERLAGPAMGALSPMMLGPLRKYRPIAAETVARALQNAARSEERGRFVYESDRIAELGA